NPVSSNCNDLRAYYLVFVKLILFKLSRISFSNDQATADQQFSRRPSIIAFEFQNHPALVEPVISDSERESRFIRHPDGDSFERSEAFEEVRFNIASH